MKRVKIYCSVTELAACKDGEFLKKYSISTGHALISRCFTTSICLFQDAHNSILSYDKDTTFFSVFDGHGGHEVATYCALHLPDFLKNTQAYKDGNISQALEDVYLEFDLHLTKPETLKELKIIAGKHIHSDC